MTGFRSVASSSQTTAGPAYGVRGGQSTLPPGRRPFSERGAPERGGSERGAGTVMAAMAVCLLAALLVGVFVLIKGASAMQRGQTAADMIALRTAQRLADGSGQDACPGQAEADRYGAELESCRIDGDEARIQVSVLVPEFGLRVRASAVAGPADAVPLEEGSAR